MRYTSRNFRWFEWSIYLSEIEKKIRHESNPTQTPAPADALETLFELTRNANHTIRLEAARALGETGSLEAGEVLAHMLLDEDHAVRWTAMHALVNLQRGAIRPLLEALTRDFQSALLRSGAHHVLLELHQHGHLTGIEAEVLHALEGTAPGIQAAWAANNALIAGD